MKFSIGYNHDIRLFDILEKYRNNIDTFYFPIPIQYLPTSRHIPQKGSYIKEIPEIIKKCDSLGIAPQLVLNATCEGTKGLEKKSFQRVIEYIQKLKKLGLKSVIVINPVYIIEIKKQIKGIKVETSVNSYVKTAEHALYLKDLGVDVLCIDNDINRDIQLIKEIKRKTNLEIKILLNEGCLRNCPFEKMHWNFIAHRETDCREEMLSGSFLEKWGLRFFSKDPAKIFSAQFIPPEALKYYTSFVDRFKIASRDAPTSIIESYLKAYVDQRFNGNLLELLNCVCLSGYFTYIDARFLNKTGFFKKMLKCKGNCKVCDYCDMLVDEAVITDSYFLPPDDPRRIKENKKAVKIYQRILRTEKSAKVSLDKGAIYSGLAKSCFLLKDYEKAISAIKMAKELNCWQDSLQALLGFCYEKTGRYAQAIEQLKEAREINPGEAQIDLALSNSYKNIGLAEQASRELEKAMVKIKKRSLSKNSLHQEDKCTRREN